MSRKKKSDNSDKDKNDNTERSKERESTDEIQDSEEEREYMKYLTAKEKKKFNSMLEKSGFTEDELVADAISQYTKRKNLGKKEKAKDHLLLIDDFNEVLATIPPEYRQPLIKYKLKEDMLWQL